MRGEATKEAVGGGGKEVLYKYAFHAVGLRPQTWLSKTELIYLYSIYYIGCKGALYINLTSNSRYYRLEFLS